MAKKARNRPAPTRQTRKPRTRREAKPSRSAPTRVSLASLPTAALTAELKRRQSELPKLEKAATKLRAELAAVEARIASLVGPTTAPKVESAKPARAPSARASAPRKTLKGQPTIGEHIVEILSTQTGALSPKEIGDILGRRLSREVNTNFLVQISLTLARLVKQGRVNKIGRGQYSASGASVASND